LAQKNTNPTDANSYLNYLVGRVRCKNRKAVDQEAALFRPSEFQYPCNSQNSTLDTITHSWHYIYTF